MDVSEKHFEQDIETYLLTKGGYEKLSSSLNVNKCIYLNTLVDFIAKTQPKEWNKYLKFYGNSAPEKLYTRLEKVISEQGLIYVLRNGIEDMGMKLKVCYFKPESDLNEDLNEKYKNNILGCARQFRYSVDKQNTIDMVLSLNGIPIVALELKNQFKNQDYRNAVNQYKSNRNSKEFAFRPNHRFLVYFAVDLDEVWMTTMLKDENTRFMPFNMGSNGAGVNGGAGNPINPDGYKTSYLWEQVLQRDSLLDLLHRFISFVKEDEETIDKNGNIKTVTREKIIFPRYHQYDVVRKIIQEVKEKGPGQNYLIQHSAGSGKSNSIAWVAYRLASLHNNDNKPIYDSVIVVTNRIVLDNQLQDTINSFEHIPGLVEAIDNKKHSRDLATALNDRKRIIITTIQKFIFAQKDIEAFSNRNFAIIVDEAHQGQSGESARTLRRSLIDTKYEVRELAEEEDVDQTEIDMNNLYYSLSLGFGKHKNQSFFAFTATPKNKTIELFGRKDPVSGTMMPFHVYSMKQAIEEGYILDVLSNYTTIKEAFKIVKVSKDNPELIEGEASKALFKYYKEHGYTIAQKTEMIMSNFLQNCRYQINGKGKAMVVASSRANAVRYFYAIKDYIKNHPKECEGTNVCVAFSGDVYVSELPQEKQPFNETTMNQDEDGKFITTDKKFRKAFHSSLFNIMVVANKYQTGFDEPYLHSMYIDKKLDDVNTVQTLSRLNRTTHGKNSTFVLDFENTSKDIKEDFAPFYEATVLSGNTDLNKVYDLRNRINDYMLYNLDDAKRFVEFLTANQDKKQSESAIGLLKNRLAPIIERFVQLDDDKKETAREYLIKFAGSYSYITQLFRINDKELFEEYQLVSHLVKVLPKRESEGVDIDDKVKLEYASLIETFKGAILLEEKPPVLKPGNNINPSKKEKKYDTLESIISKVNDHFDGKFTENDRVIIEGIYNMFMQDKEVVKYKKYAKDNSTEMFVKSLFPDKFKAIVTECFLKNNESFQKLFNDPEFYEKVKDAMANELYKTLRK